VESIEGSDYCVLVTEPTPFGLNDLILAVEVVRKLGIPCGIVINRDGFGDNKTENYCKTNKIPILMRIPLDTEIAKLYSRGIPLVQGMPEWHPRFQQLYDDIVNQTRVKT
jgi:MinD superfamily P-loop ATPase